MDATDFDQGKEERRPSGGMHPLAAAVALALAGALAGCASQSVPPDAPEVDRAKAAFARKDYTEAARLLSEPAMKGDAGAQYALGYLYYYGQGVPQDFYRARTWLETSAQLGNRDAKRALATLKVYGKLPPADGAKSPATAQAPKVAPAQEQAGLPANSVKQESAAAAPAMAPASATPAGAAPENTAAAPAPSVTPAPETKVTAVPEAKVTATPEAKVTATPEANAMATPPPAAAITPVAPTPAAVAPVVVVPAPAAPAPEERAPMVAAPAAPAAPVSAAPSAEPFRPAPTAPAVPQENSTTPDSETAAATGPAPELQARSPEAAVGAEPNAGSVPAREPVESAPALPDETGVVARESGAEPVAMPVALERPAPAAVTLVPGSEQAQPIIRKPAPRSERPRYTIHLLSSPSKEELFQTVRTFGLAQAAWYPVEQGNGTQYRLIFGGYESVTEARAALRALPEALYARNPWVNNYPESVTITAFNGIPTARVAAVERNILR